MTIRYSIATALFLILVSCATPTVIFAATQSSVLDTSSQQTSVQDTTGSGKNVTLFNPLKAGTSLSSLLSDILAFVIRIGVIVVILMIVYVGFKFVMAQGKPGEIEAAKKMLFWTLVGALILLGAQAIASAIQATVTAIGG